jgi:membrane-bound lytic murein transglycosylase D
MEKSIPMNVFKLLCLLFCVSLVGCTTVPLTPSADLSASTPSDTLALQASREIMAVQPQPLAKPTQAQIKKWFSNTPDTTPLSPISEELTRSSEVVELTAPTDLWDRIRRGYAMPDLDNDLVRDREQWYTARPEYFFRMTQRSQRYLFHIVEELEMRNMPTELALLPFIESAFNPQAVSSAKAAGIWQFMPATGKYFELKQNVFRDDRRDVLASTRAALDYLQKLHRMFGDWHLALAAYNWGEGNVLRSVRNNKRAGKSASYEDINMPMETRMYIPKLQAVKNIVADPARFRSKLPHFENHPYFQSVTLQRDMDVVVAAKLAEVSIEDFKALNPSINRPVILAAGTPQILLPWENAEIFQRNYESFGGGRLASWTAWIAPTTMSAAEAARRVGMDESELRKINHIPSRMVIKAGSTLLVHRAAHIAHDVTEKVADNGQISLAAETVSKRINVRAKKKDTVASIASRYKVSAAQVAQWNKVGKNASFKPGQKIVVFTQVSAFASNKSTASSTKSKRVAHKKSSNAKKTAAKQSKKSKATASAKKKTNKNSTKLAKK